MPAPNTLSLKSLRDRRVELHNEMKDLLDKRGRKEGDYNGADKDRWELLTKESAENKELIAQYELFESEFGDDDFSPADINPGNPKIKTLSQKKSSVRLGYDMTAKFRSLGVEPQYVDYDPGENSQKRFLCSEDYNRAFLAAMADHSRSPAEIVRRMVEKMDCPEGVTTDDYDSGGWLTTPMQILSGILRCCDRRVRMRQLARIFTVGTEASLGVRKHNSNEGDAEWGSECAEPPEIKPTGNMKVLTPTILSARISMCRELIRNTTGNIVNWYIEEMGRVIAYKLEQAYLYGTGSNQPLGLLTEGALTSDRYVSYEHGSTFDGDDLIDMLCSIPECYQGGNLGWMASRRMFCAIMKLKTEYGYLWSTTADRGLAVGMPVSLLGHPFMVSEFMTPYAPGQSNSVGYVPLIIGDYSQYWIADKNSQLTERQICPRTDRVSWYSRLWTDGMPMCDEAFTAMVVVDES